jgi:hypothetical protein
VIYGQGGVCGELFFKSDNRMALAHFW